MRAASQNGDGDAEPSTPTSTDLRPTLRRLYLIAFEFLARIHEFDSFDQYGQAIGQSLLNDWHPVIMTLMWKGFISI
jgi:hypothetical protein